MMYQPLLTGFKAAAGAGRAGQKTRMAGTAWQQFLRWAKDSVKYGISGSSVPVSREHLGGALAARLVPDVIGGGITAIHTPGDLGDKAIAGLTDTISGAVGGIALSGASRGLTKGSTWKNLTADMLGSSIGFQASLPASDALLRVKDSLQGGPGMSPYEKLDEQRRREIEMNLLNKLGLGPRPW